MKNNICYRESSVATRACVILESQGVHDHHRKRAELGQKINGIAGRYFKYVMRARTNTTIMNRPESKKPYSPPINGTLYNIVSAKYQILIIKGTAENLSIILIITTLI